MLLLPVLLGVAASRPDPWQLAVAGLALAAYLASATAQTWSRSRRPAEYRLPIIVYGSIAAVLGVLLLVAFPPLALAGVVVVPTAAIVFRGAQPGTRRDLANSLLQVVQSLVLVPVAAWVSGDWDPARVATYTLIAAGYQLGVVLVVRSVLRERGNKAFLGASVGFHGLLVAAALVTLPVPYAILAAGLMARSVGLVWLQRRLASDSRALRPVHVGVTEIVASAAVVIVSLAVPV
jgi:hypothetical protein